MVPSWSTTAQSPSFASNRPSTGTSWAIASWILVISVATCSSVTDGGFRVTSSPL